MNHRMPSLFCIILLAITCCAASVADQKLISTMAESNGLPLESYSKTVPPGWNTGIPHFPFRRYLERLRLWYRWTDLLPEQVGPAVAGRLGGRVFNHAMAMSITLRNGAVLSGDAALAFAGAGPILDAQGAQIAPAVTSGLQQLITLLQGMYGADDQ